MSPPEAELDFGKNRGGVTEAIENLNDDERVLLDEIAQDLTRRTIARATERLFTIDRVI